MKSLFKTWKRALFHLIISSTWLHNSLISLFQDFFFSSPFSLIFPIFNSSTVAWFFLYDYFFSTAIFSMPLLNSFKWMVAHTTWYCIFVGRYLLLWTNWNECIIVIITTKQTYYNVHTILYYEIIVGCISFICFSILSVLIILLSRLSQQSAIYIFL